MKIIQTFWTGNPTSNGNRSIDIKAGWPTCEYHWMSWALSSLQARALFDQLELVTDHFGKEILIDRLGLPFTKVSTDLEGVLKDYPPQTWALAKIFSYGLQTEPFLHIDGDVFLWEEPNQRIMKAAIISQNLEKDLPFYKATLDGMGEIFPALPPIYHKGYYENKTIYAANAGLIGGNDLSFFKTYCEEAFAFVDAIKRDLNKINPANISNLNFLFEQYALYHIALREKREISFYLDEVIETPVYENLIRFQDRPSVKMIHPVGGFKKQLHLCDHLSNTLRTSYPSYYYRVIDMVRKEGAPMLNKIYYFSSPDLPENPFKVHDRTLEAMELWHPNKEQDCKEKELIAELNELEEQKDQLFDKIFSQEAEIRSAYEREASVYSNLQQAFSLSPSETGQLTLKVNENALILELGWKWQYFDKSMIKQVLEKNLAAEKALHMVVLVPSIVRVNIYEHYLDQLDMIIVDTVRNGSYTIATLIEDIKQYFDPDEINTIPGGLEKLVVDTLKRLSYAGVLMIL